MDDTTRQPAAIARTAHAHREPGACHVVPTPFIASTSSYRVPLPAGKIDLWLDSNEGREPDHSLVEALREVDPELIRRYPSKSDLECAIAEAHGVTPERVIVTSGGDDAIDRCCRAVLEAGRKLILPVPTFEMIARSARLSGGEVIEIEWFDGPFPTSVILEHMSERTSMVAIVSPSNPTGSIATVEDVRAIAEAAPRALILVDLAYIEFADHDLTAAVLQLPNAVAVRTFSKAFGLAGLRVGYAFGTERVIEWLRAAGSPYPVAGPSLALAQRVLAEPGRRRDVYLDRIRCARDQLRSFLAQRAITTLPSQANFVLARFDDAHAMHKRLAQRGISVRAFPDDPRLASWLRITCPGDEDQFARLTAALEDILSESDP